MTVFGVRRRAVALGVAVLLLAACGDTTEEAAPEDDVIRRTFDDEPTEAAAAPSATSTEGSTDERSATSQLEEPGDEATGAAMPGGSDVVPPWEELPEPTGRDWQQVAQAILDLQTAAYEERDTSALTKAYRSVCNCWDFDAEQIASLVGDNFTFSWDVAPRVTDVTVERDDPGSILLVVRIETTGVDLVNGDGDLVREFPARAFEEWWTLASDDGKGGPWRAIDITPIEG